MYKLTRYFNLHNKIRFIAAVAYMCCGYNTGHLQHFNWLSGAAFLPWCIWGYLMLQRSFSIKNIFLSGILFYLFISSAHPGLIIGAIYFFIALSVFLFFKNDDRRSIPARIKQFTISNVVLMVIFIILSAGMIAGYIDILPWFSRGAEVSLNQGLKSPTTIQSWISALLPLSTVKNDGFFATDISMRNVYFSILLLLFLFSSTQKNSWKKFFLFTGLAFLLLSAGGIFKTFAWKFIPLISYVRLDGEFVIFSLLCFTVTAAIGLNNFITEKKEFKGGIKWIYYILEIILFACIAVGLYKTINSKEGFLYSFDNIAGQSGLSQKLKALIDAISFYDTLWLQGIIQLMILWGIKFCLRERRLNLLVRIVIADVIIATLLNLPFTGVGKSSTKEVQQVLNMSPKGIPVPSLLPIINNDTISTKEKGLVGDWSFYNKQIGVKKEVPYPIRLKNTIAYFEWIRLKPGMTFLNENFLFTGNASPPSITEFSGNNLKFKINVQSDSDYIIYQQAFYPHWYYNNGKEKKEVLKHFSGFMEAPLIKGENQLEFSFEPTKVKIGMVISLISFIMILLILIFNPPFIRRSLFPS